MRVLFAALFAALLPALAAAQSQTTSGEDKMMCRVHDGTDVMLVAADGSIGVTGTFWQATQPVSGTVTVTDGAGALNTIVDSSALPTGAATAANQLPDGHNVTVDNAAGASAVNIQDGGNSITVDGTVTVGTFPDNEPINVSQVGGAVVAAGPCEREVNLYAQIDQTSGEQIITGTASERIYICAYRIITATAQNIALVDGTGTVCATSPTGLLGGSTAATGDNLAANGGLVQPWSPQGWAKTSTDADNVCLLQSGAGQVSGVIVYVSIPNI